MAEKQTILQSEVSALHERRPAIVQAGNLMPGRIFNLWAQKRLKKIFSAIFVLTIALVR
jgi:hypothetical protein